MGGYSITRFGRRYKTWLIDMVKGGDHTILLDILYNTEFVWCDDVPFDKNRSGKGVYLRARFNSESRMDYDYASDAWPCSLLEMFVALAMDIEDTIMYEPELGDRTYMWFWLMLDNLELSEFDDENLGLNIGEDYAFIETVLERFLNREYEASGKGGAFPMRHTDKDQRFVELWYQANEYAISGWMRPPKWIRHDCVSY